MAGNYKAGTQNTDGENAFWAENNAKSKDIILSQPEKKLTKCLAEAN